jgi:flagellar L-ring protein precursor FlgH
MHLTNDKKMKVLFAVLLTTMLTGCQNWLDSAGLMDQTVLPPALPIDNPPPPKSTGSIYQSGYEIALYRDRIPSHRGDILTVKLEEQTQGEKKARLKANKEGDYAYKLPGLEKGKITGHIADFTSMTDFNGGGESNQQNKLHGTISVTVTRVLSNGNLMIQGESWLTINQGREYVRLTGIVRPYDVDSKNVISSQRIANARITYSGNGQVANAANSGLFTQFLLKFFPY